MAIKLVRESSETPNITNQDDARMVRYAYSGYTGFVKNYLDEVGYQIDGTKFKLKGGVVVVNGWEVSIENGSWELDLSTISGTQYYTIYLTVNLTTETAVIRSVYASGAYPTVQSGDDLTEDPYGEANVVLYHVKAVSGRSSEVSKIIQPIPYINEKVADIEERLERLGFKEGELSFSDYGWSGSPSNKSYVKRQGNYVICVIEGATFSSNISDTSYRLIATIPEGFRPKFKEGTNYFTVFNTHDAITDFQGVLHHLQTFIGINKSGEISVLRRSSEGYLPSGLDHYSFDILCFGYETNPL